MATMIVFGSKGSKGLTLVSKVLTSFFDACQSHLTHIYDEHLTLKEIVLPSF